MLLRQRQWKGEKQPAVPSDGVPAFGVCGYQIILGALTGNPRCIRGNLHDKLRLSLNHPRWRLGSRESGRLFFVHFPDNRRSTGEFYRFFGLRGPQSLK
jgi:hypothetical protein